jgi:hypothetical protein
VNQRKEFKFYDEKTKEVYWSDGTKSVFTDKNGKPVVPEKFVKKMKKIKDEEWAEEKRRSQEEWLAEMKMKWSKSPPDIEDAF